LIWQILLSMASRRPKLPYMSKLKHNNAKKIAILILVMLIALSTIPTTRTIAQDSSSRATAELFKAAETNDLEMVKRAIYAGADLRARNSLGQRAHDVAVDMNNMAIAHYILSMRPKTPKRKVRVVVPQVPLPAPAKLPPPVKPLALAKPKLVPKKATKPKAPAVNKPVVAAISKKQSEEIRKQTDVLKPVAVAKPIAKPVTKPVVKSAVKSVTKKIVPKPVSKVAKSVQPAKAGKFYFFGNPIPQKSSAGMRCLDKPGDIRICLFPLKWPRQLASWFEVDTVYYDGPQSLVMYEGGQLKQIHVLYKRAGYDAIVNFLGRQLSSAGQSGSLKKSESTETYLAKESRITTWIGLKGSWPDSLEVRELDSLRWSGLPDEHHGAIRVMKKGADPIFKHVSSADFMLGSITLRK
jgi:hypothetical protein